MTSDNDFHDFGKRLGVFKVARNKIVFVCLSFIHVLGKHFHRRCEVYTKYQDAASIRMKSTYVEHLSAISCSFFLLMILVTLFVLLYPSSCFLCSMLCFFCVYVCCVFLCICVFFYFVCASMLFKVFQGGFCTLVIENV